MTRPDFTTQLMRLKRQTLLLHHDLKATKKACIGANMPPFHIAMLKTCINNTHRIARDLDVTARRLREAQAEDALIDAVLTSIK